MTLSPCVSKCALDPTRDHCISCGRLLTEIREWKNMDEFGKGFAVMTAKLRIKQYNPL